MHGNHEVYDQNGYEVIVPTIDPSSFHNKMKELQDLNWVNIHTKFFYVTINFFNFNINSVIVFHLYYEKEGNTFNPNFRLYVLNQNKIFNSLALGTLIFSFLTLLTSIYMILRDKKSRDETRVVLLKEYDKYLSFSSRISMTEHENVCVVFFKRIYYNVVYFFRLYFIQPNFFLILSK